MDRPLKERTIGAVVLVAFAVLVVPVFLDGPSNDGDTVTETVALPGQNNQPRRQQTIVLERDRDEPVPVPGSQGRDAGEGEESADAAVARPVPDLAPVAEDTSATTAAEGAAEPAPEKTVEKAPEKAPEKAAAAPQSASSLWAVQLGSFSRRENADRLAADLRDDGYAAFVTRLDTSNGELHRVRVGPQANRDQAEKVAGTLADAGHSGQVVPHP